MSKKNPDWDRGELILALDLYFRLPPNRIRSTETEVIELSKVLKSLPIYPELAGQPTFRSPESVKTKLFNFQSLDSSKGGAGLDRTGIPTQEIWKEFREKRQEVSSLAEAIRRSITRVPEFLHAQEEDEEQASSEGKIFYRLHRGYERDPELVRRKKRQFLVQHAELSCEACGFSFKDKYGDLGDGFIECHHTRALSQLSGETKTRLADLALLCSNCHRMIHRKRPWLDMSALKALIRS